jgi:hypothetical protein
MCVSLFLMVYVVCLIVAGAIKSCHGNKLDKDGAKLILSLIFWPIALFIVVGHGVFSLIWCFLNLRTIFKTAFGKEE